MEERKALPGTTPADAANEILEQPAFEGYTLSELKYHRALAEVKRQFAKERMLRNVDHLRSRTLFRKKDTPSTPSGKFGGVARLVSKGLTHLELADYAMLGFTLFGTGKKIWKFVKRRR